MVETTAGANTVGRDISELMPVDNTLLAENSHYKHTIDYTSL